MIQPGWTRGNPLDALTTREWLVTNGLGGYASGTISGAATRRFHGELIAALPAPHGRVMMLNHLDERATFGGSSFRLGVEEMADRNLELPQDGWLSDFHLELGLPVWVYQRDGFVMEKRLLLPYLQNTTYVIYRLVKSPSPVTLELKPWIRFRRHDGALEGPIEPYRIERVSGGLEIAGSDPFPPLRVALFGRDVSFAENPEERAQWLYRLERSRGHDSVGPLWSPGTLRFTLPPGEDCALVASAEPWGAVRAMTPREAHEAEMRRRAKMIDRAHPDTRSSFGMQLVLAADQFLITPQTRLADVVRAHAGGDPARTVIAGYHWFTDWGRDTMISLEGLTLVTRRFREAGAILRTFASHVRDGLIPNFFPEGDQEGLYHTVDATLWFVHAVHRYTELSGDRSVLRALLPVLREIIRHHLEGTRFGIGVDPKDGLLRQGAEGFQLTWMDAKVGDWVVTPRRGKAVEINALFYNALRLMERWTREDGKAREADVLKDHATRAQKSFNDRFWYAAGKYLYDVVDAEPGDDRSLRPNQILAISLPYPVLDRARWEPVVEAVERELVTPVGLRTLSRHHPDYKKRYDGDLRARDAAYHQGTVWPWLIGPFIDAWLRTHPNDLGGARRYLEGFIPHLADACIGTISEIFDAEEPWNPRGCASQAWSVAEVLRCLSITAQAAQRPAAGEMDKVAA